MPLYFNNNVRQRVLSHRRERALSPPHLYKNVRRQAFVHDSEGGDCFSPHISILLSERALSREHEAGETFSPCPVYSSPRVFDSPGRRHNAALTRGVSHNQEKFFPGRGPVIFRTGTLAAFNCREIRSRRRLFLPSLYILTFANVFCPTRPQIRTATPIPRPGSKSLAHEIQYRVVKAARYREWTLYSPQALKR